MKRYTKVAVAALALIAVAVGAQTLSTYTAAWNAPTAAIDGSALVGPTTYQVYVGNTSMGSKDPYGSPVASLSEIVVPSAPGLMCITVTAISSGIESVPSNEACVTVPGAPPVAVVPVKPNPPTGVTLK